MVKRKVGIVMLCPGTVGILFNFVSQPIRSAVYRANWTVDHGSSKTKIVALQRGR